MWFCKSREKEIKIIGFLVGHCKFKSYVARKNIIFRITHFKKLKESLAKATQGELEKSNLTKI